MKIATVLLRWYKSFNVNYTGYSDRKPGVAKRPWNLLGRSAETEQDFPFIEIPLENDITTIVGANESGKSHLLSAISKVITGHGIPEGNRISSAYSRTDLCHYTSPRSKNAEDWPNLGLQFNAITSSEEKAIADAIGRPSLGKLHTDSSALLTLVIAPDGKGTDAYLYLHDDDKPIPLDAAALQRLRTCLPKVEFIKSELAIADQVPIGTLLSALGSKNDGHLFDYAVAQEVASSLLAISIGSPDSTLPKEITKTLTDLREKLANARLDQAGSELEALLFRDVLGITVETLQFVNGLSIAARTHADGLTSKWNCEIDQILNLSHYWQQDDSFALRITYRQGILFFEITDKTGATYTFKERSSGLRYFLSYYIQAKALEKTSANRNTIVLMDEPDSFLSILGQRNLLAVFESLVRPELSSQNCQLVYTTHSPFLINRNYPRRLRLVRKGDAEEGTQLVDRAMLRRYEPVRSALGIDCAQTLFMGATNIVVEGPTDQYIICELIRFFATPGNVNDFLDLNSVVMVSAESAPVVEKLLSASKWGDESIPATVVLLDSDEGGDTTRERITGNVRGCKKLIDDSFVLQIAEILGATIGQQKIVTTEDLIPADLYGRALVQYIQKWHPEVPETKRKEITDAVRQPASAERGIVDGTRALMNTYVHDTKRDYDKFGVLQDVVAILHASPITSELRDDLAKRLALLCQSLRRAVSASEQMARRITGKQAIRRLIDEFFVIHKESSSVFDVQLLLDRIKKDIELLGVDGEGLDASVKRLSAEVARIRASSQQHLVGQAWAKWKSVMQAIRQHPLGVKVIIIDGNPTTTVVCADSVDTDMADGNGRQPSTSLDVATSQEGPGVTASHALS